MLHQNRMYGLLLLLLFLLLLLLLLLLFNPPAPFDVAMDGQAA